MIRYKLIAYSQSNRFTVWKIEVSNDKNDWIGIDNKSGELNVPNYSRSFQINQTSLFSSTKITQTGIRTKGNEWLFALKGFEIFDGIIFN
jgi:hypothetical protein